MKKQIRLTTLSAGLICLSITTSADAALISRLGGLAYYDDVANLTWLADANAAQTSGFDSSGQMTWQVANDWAAQLTVGGVSGWRLPTTTAINGVSFNQSFTNDGSTDVGRNVSRPGTVFGGSAASEMAHLFYNTLGNVSDYDVSGVFDDGCTGSCLVNTGPFTNLQSSAYWSSELEFFTFGAWDFNTMLGVQNSIDKGFSQFAWAVHSGDVSAVPVPAAVWLFSSGLIGLLGVAKRKKPTL